MEAETCFLHSFQNEFVANAAETEWLVRSAVSGGPFPPRSGAALAQRQEGRHASVMEQMIRVSKGCLPAAR